MSFPTCVTDIAYATAGTQQAVSISVQGAVDIAIQVALALWQRNASKSINNMQIGMADLQMRMAEEVQAHAVQYYPAEAALVSDAFGEAKAVTTYNGLAGEWGTLLSESMEAGRQTWLEVLDDACLAPDLCEDARWQRNGQLAQADILSYAARQDESRTQILNDRRYARQLAALGLSTGQLADAISYQKIGNFSGQVASDMLIGTVNSALQAYGYYPMRDPPVAGWGAGIAQSWGFVRTPPPVAQVVSNVQREALEQPRVMPPVIDYSPQRQPAGKGPGEIGEGLYQYDLERNRAALRSGEI